MYIILCSLILLDIFLIYLVPREHMVQIYVKNILAFTEAHISGYATESCSDQTVFYKCHLTHVFYCLTILKKPIISYRQTPLTKITERIQPSPATQCAKDDFCMHTTSKISSE